MAILTDLTGCKVLIKDDEDGAVIAEAIVLLYDRKRLTITVSSQGIKDYYNKQIFVLIINDKFVYEFSGFVRKNNEDDLAEITLFKGKEKEVRANTRHRLNLKCVIDNIVPKNPNVHYEDNIEVSVINLSKDGILIETLPALLDVKTTYRLKIIIEDNPVFINTEVVRVIEKDDTVCLYGGSFLSFENPQDDIEK